MIARDIEISSPVHNLFSQRYSGVSFDPARPVSQEQLLSIAEAARWSPSCFGDQPWRFLICNKASNPESWQTALDCLMEGNQAWCKHAPVLIVTCCNTLFSRNGKANTYGPYDSGAAALAMCLQAAAMGLMTHQMGGFMADKARELFAIPEQFKPMAMMALGYQLPESELTEEQSARELAPRTRNPLNQHFFAGAWDKGLQEQN